MQSRAERLAPLTGVAFLVLFAGGFVLAGKDSPDFVDKPSKYLSYYADQKGSIMAGGLVLLLAAAVLLWFLGSVRRASLAAEGGDGRLTGIAFAGGAVGIALFVAAISAIMVPALRLDNDQKLTVETATTFQDLGSVLIGMAAPIGFGILLIATAIVGIRHGGFPKVWSWFTALLGVIMLVPMISWAGMFFLFPLWVLVMAIMLMRAGAREGATA